MVQSHLPPFRNLGNFVHPTFACLSEKTVKAGGPCRGGEGKISHTQGKCVTCNGLTNSRVGQPCVSPSLGCLEKTS